jgi:hypothetical protein
LLELRLYATFQGILLENISTLASTNFRKSRRPVCTFSTSVWKSSSWIGYRCTSSPVELVLLSSPFDNGVSWMLHSQLVSGWLSRSHILRVVWEMGRELSSLKRPYISGRNCWHWLHTQQRAYMLEVNMGFIVQSPIPTNFNNVNFWKGVVTLWCCHCTMFQGDYWPKKKLKKFASHHNDLCCFFASQLTKGWTMGGTRISLLLLKSDYMLGDCQGCLRTLFWDARNILSQLMGHAWAASSVRGNMAWQICQGICDSKKGKHVGANLVNQERRSGTASSYNNNIEMSKSSMMSPIIVPQANNNLCRSSNGSGDRKWMTEGNIIFYWLVNSMQKCCYKDAPSCWGTRRKILDTEIVVEHIWNGTKGSFYIVIPWLDNGPSWNTKSVSWG